MFSRQPGGSTDGTTERFERVNQQDAILGSEVSTCWVQVQCRPNLAAANARMRGAQVAEVTQQAEARLSEGVTGAAVALLDSAPPDFWPRAQRLHATAVQAADEVLAWLEKLRYTVFRDSAAGVWSVCERYLTN